MRVSGAVLVAAVLVAGCGGDDPATTAPSTSSPVAAAKPAPPAAPTTSPKHRSARTTTLGAVTIVQPAGPAPREAPVVVFTQGTGAAAYQDWIDHLVGRGAIVVFQDATTDATAADGVRLAVRTLARGPVRPRWDRLTLVGHSIGGVLSTRLAAAAGVPRPGALVAVQPPAPEGPVPALPAGIRVVVVEGDRDDRVADGPRRLWAALARVPAADKEFVTVRSDDRGEPALEATHLFPVSARDADALDRALWGLLDAVLDGRPLEPDVGTWSDGTPITPMEISDNP